MTNPQERYWELKAELFAVEKSRKEAQEDFAKMLCGMGSTDNPMDYEAAVLCQDADEALADMQEAFRQISDAHIDFIVIQLEEIDREHGPMKLFSPALIEAAFRDDIQPLWPVQGMAP